MNNGMVLFLCFLPLGIIYIVMKLSLLLSSSISEINYVKEDAKRPHGEYLENAYADLDEEEEDY
tara:strand:- start:766 stop:957 length:192 start_codon:yes stop_codon:yes gene_type:complete